VIIAAIAVAGYFAAPAVGKGFNNIIGGDKNQSKATKSIQSERILYQVDPLRPDKLIPVKEKYNEQTYNLDTIQPPETFWQKFVGLGAWLILIGVIITGLGLWPLILMWINKLKSKIKDISEQKDELRGDAKLIVTSIDEGLAAMNTAITSADNTYDIASKTLANAGLTLDPVQRASAIANAQLALNTADAVLTAVTNLKKEFLSAMSRKQDTTTKLLVAELKND
jgi:hypothetical protein